MNPKKLIQILPVSLLIALASFKAAGHYNAETDMKAMVLQEYEGFKQLAPGYNLQLGDIIFADQATHVTNGSKDVVINPDELILYTQGQSEAFKKMFIKLVIGHELGHKVQFNSYRPEVIRKSRGEAIVFLECYADLLSGMMVSALENNGPTASIAPAPGAAAIRPQNLDLIFSVLKKVLEMERTSVDAETHPRNIERMFAFKQGLLMGNCWLLHLVLQNNTPAFNQLTDSQKQYLKSSSELLDRELSYDPVNANNPITWCQAEAIRIIHECNSVDRNLIRFDQHINWDTDPNHATVDFSFRVLNTNLHSVQFNGRVYTEIIPRNDRKNVLKIGTNDSYAFQYDIPAGQSVLISGRLNWVADDNYMPQIVIPGDERSLYWAFDNNNPMPDTVAIASFDANFNEWKGSTPDDIADMVTKVILIKAKLPENTRGLGISEYANETDATVNKLTYEPLFKSGAEDDQKIFVYKNEPQNNYYGFTAFSTVDTARANQRFMQIVNAMKIALPQYKTSGDRILGNLRTIGFHKDREIAVRMTLDYGRNGKPAEARIAVSNR